MGRSAVRITLTSKGYWIGRYPVEGGRAIERTLIQDREIRGLRKPQREKLLESLYLQRQPEGKVFEDTYAVRKSQDFEEEKRAFYEMLETQNSSKTLKEYKSVLRELEDIDMVEELKAKWLRYGLSPHTVNKKLRTIRRFENWRIRRENNKRVSQGLQPLAARRWEDVSADTRTIKSFTDEQLDELLALIERRKLYPPPTVDERMERRWELLRRAFFLLRYTGMRGGEVNALRWSDILLHPLDQDSYIHIRSHLDAAGRPFNVKGDHEELMPIAFESMIIELGRWERTHEFVLEGYWSSSLELGRAFKSLQTELGIDPTIKPLHGFRASFCTKLFKLGLSTEYVRRAMRHQSAETTKRYLDARNDGLGSALRQATQGL